MITIHHPQIKTIKLSDYEKFFLPFLKDQSIDSSIFYKIKDKSLHISFAMNNFIVLVQISEAELRERYREQNSEIPDVGERSDTVEFGSLLSRVNADLMDGRGIEEI